MTLYYQEDASLTEDERRLAAVVLMVDQICDVDLHERATEYAAGRGDEEPTERDYLNAVRDALDNLRAENTDTGAP